MNFTKEEVWNYVKEKTGASEFNLMFGLTNNCPRCHWSPCICKELKEMRQKNG